MGPESIHLEVVRRNFRAHCDGLSAYGQLAREGLERVRIVQGQDRSRAPKLLPWSRAIISNLKSWLRGTFHGVSPK